MGEDEEAEKNWKRMAIELLNFFSQKESWWGSELFTLSRARIVNQNVRSATNYRTFGL